MTDSSRTGTQFVAALIGTIAQTNKRRSPRNTQRAAWAAMHLELAEQALATHADGSSSALVARDAALLAWLAIEGPTSRARLAELLWPGSASEAARNALRQHLFRLRKSNADLLAGSTTLRLADGVAHDLADSEGVLGDLQFPDAPELDAWLRGQRERRANTQRQDLERQADALEQAGELAAALPVAQALLRLDHTSEAAHRHVMRLHYLRGDRAAALLAFDACERSLKDEVGARPSTETLALLHTIEQAHAHEWRPGQALPAAALRPPQLIGRASELTALADAWSTGHLFVLTGQAGAGKSRLLDVLAEAEPGVLLVRARPGDDKVPLATLDRLVHRLSERWPALGAVPAYARFVAHMAGPADTQPPSAQSVAPMLAELLRAARAVATEGLSGLVLDDLQFADDASVDIWHELLVWPALAGLRFGFASRVDGAAAAARIAALSTRSDALVVPLEPLAASAVQPFVESLALPLVDAGAVAAALVRRIGGNPLHLLETIRHALEKHGQLRADNLEAPARVTELLEQRLLALPADGLLLVRIAAVAGNQFDPDLAAAVSRRDVLELADAWHNLERQGLLDARGFMHDLIGEAAHRLLPQPIERVLHARVAAHLEQRGIDAARLAHHLLCAGDEAAAVPHLALAARQAWHLGRSRETCDAYLKAADIELARGQPDAAFDLLFDCAEAITELGPATAFEEVVERLAPLAHTPSQFARLAWLRAVGFNMRGDHAGYLARADETMMLAIACEDRLVEAECRVGKGYYAATDGRLHEALQQLTAAVALHRGLGREKRARELELHADATLVMIGQVRRALEKQRLAQQQLIEAGPSITLALLTSRQADNEHHMGEIGAARLSADRAVAVLRATEMTSADVQPTVRFVAEAYRRCGDWRDALEFAGEAMLRMSAQGDLVDRVAEALADIYLDLGRPDLAHRHIESFAAASVHSVRLSQRSLALRWRYQLGGGARIDAAAALASSVQSEDLLMSCDLVLVAGQAAQPEVTTAQCAALIARCDPQGLRGMLVPLNALRAWLLARDDEMQAAQASLASTRRELMRGELGAVTPLCELWFARTLQALGQPAEAALQARHAAGWLTKRAKLSVPAEFRDSFLHRNPVHAELLAWASRAIS